MISDSKPITKIRNAVPLGHMTSFRVGGTAEWFAAPSSTAELADALAWNHERKLSLTLIGAGSNLLISDDGLPGLVICTRQMRGIYFDEKTGQITAAAGEPVARLAWQAAAKGWSGLEWAVGIPGTVGGLVVMNAGAQGGCAADRLIQTETVSTTGELKTLRLEDLNYRYRSSALQEGSLPQNSPRHIVTSATLQLCPGNDPEKVTASTTEHLKFRHATQPYNLPSCGSVFRNPHPYAAAWLIEQTGLKGYQIGKAQVATLHANFILNCGGASARDIFRLICYVREQVQEKWILSLEPEVKMLGNF